MQHNRTRVGNGERVWISTDGPGAARISITSLLPVARNPLRRWLSRLLKLGLGSVAPRRAGSDGEAVIPHSDHLDISVTHSIKRRNLLIGLPLLVGMSVVPALHAAESRIAEIERRYGGRLGVFALDAGSGRTLSHRADERFLMCSTFKGLLAAQTLARVDAGEERLDRLVHYTEKDLIFTSPVTKANLARGALPVETLCQAMLEESDNTAAILLMRSAGGPAGLTQFVRGLGDTVTRSDRYEPTSNHYNGVLDTTTPRAIATLARSLLLGDVLSPRSRAQLERGMIACKPGLNRIRAAVPESWQAADRPGTSLDRQANDYALVRPPGRAPLLVAAYYDAPGVSMQTREAVLREAGAAFVQWAMSTV